MVSVSPRSKLERCFFPDVPIKKVAKECVQHLHDLCETLIVRVYMAPSTIWYEADDVKHVYADGKATIENSARTLKRLIIRDTLQLDDMKFMKGPTTTVNARVLLLESYTWTAFCLLSYTVGLAIGGWDGGLNWLIGPILHPWNSLVMLLVVPFYVHSRLRKAHLPEDEQRSECFYASFLFGVLGSYANGTPTVFAQFVAFVPLWIGTVSGYLEFREMNRLDYLGWSIGAPYLVYVLYAGVAFERFVLYASAWTVLCGVMAVDLQLKLGRLKRRWAGKEIELWDTTIVIIVAHFLLSQMLTVIDGK